MGKSVSRQQDSRKMSSLFIPERKPGHRQLRVAEEIRGILSLFLTRGEWPGAELIKQPITITQVVIAADLQNARVYVMPLGGGESQKMILEHMQNAQKFFRFYLAKALTTKFTPKLTFCLDDSFEQADRIATLLRSKPPMAE